jgi:starch-binding outer membrane protein, SusD/RagB family
MKKIKFLIFISAILLFIGCSDDFMTQKNLYEKSDESYYKTPADIEEALTGAYSALPYDAGNNNPFIVSELMSDECFGGGGSNDDGFHATDAFTLLNQDYYSVLFAGNWNGILRVNLIIKRFDQAEYTDEDARGQALGEAHFLRAYFYFRLSQFFGPVPLKLEPEPSNTPRATPEEMYGQIALDLKTAIENMPSTPATAISVSRLGHASKWAAEALLGRVFLFYTGYYNKTEIALPDGSTLSKNDVNTYLVDCIENSGHILLPDFRNNWAYSAIQRYAYTKDNGLFYASDDNIFGDDIADRRNLETVFAMKYSSYGGWNAPSKISYSNQHVLYSGLRQQSHLAFGQGWGGGPVNPQIWESFEPGDIRREGSILNVVNPTVDEGPVLDNYIWGSDNQVHETGLWQKKYQPAVDSSGGVLESIYYIYMTTPPENNMQLWDLQDDILIRFADVLLMAAELGAPNAQAYLDQVRTRAGLASKPVTLENIKAERYHELCFEGLRYFDLLRWHDAEAAFAVATNIPVKNMNEDAIYTVTYRPETGGFLPIPQTEITLSGGVLVQTPGWGL